MTILITGGCGYVGTKRTEAMLARTPHDVTVLDAMWFGNRLAPNPRLTVQALTKGAVTVLGTGFTPRKTVQMAIREMAAAFREGWLKDELISYNVHRMRQHTFA